MTPAGSRIEIAVLVLRLIGDLLSGPLHLVGFLATRRAHRRRFREMLTRSPE